MSAKIKFGVVGAEHDHIARMVKAVEDGGGELSRYYIADEANRADFARKHPEATAARAEAEVLEDSEISLVVSAAVPNERAALGVRVMRAGKDYMADKGGFLSLREIEAARQAQKETGRIYSVSYNESLLLPASVRAGELIKAGAIGRVVQMTGTGPHGLWGHGPRPPWFWTRAARGGILADIGTHQCADFLLHTGAKDTQVTFARTANYSCPEHEEFEDFGEILLQSRDASGYARVDFYEGPSLGFRLVLLGTEGSLEVRKHERRLLLANRKGRAEITVEDFVCPYGPRLVEDILNRTETAMAQETTFMASELAVRAQDFATQRHAPGEE